MDLSRRRTMALGLAAGIGAVAAARPGPGRAAAAGGHLGPGETVGPYALPPLRYDYAALEPVLDRETVRLQHDVHERACAEKVNAALARHPEWLGKSIEEVLRRLPEIPEDIREEVRNQGGGLANHQFFWKVVGPPGGPGPSGPLLEAINRDFGSFDAFKRAFETAALNHVGSGWAFMGRRRGTQKLDIITLPNNDSVLWAPNAVGGVMTCDLWEHAYYRKYSTRAEWLKAYWQIADWTVIGQRFSGVMNPPRPG
jgi:Fe-Mn family superoxide dismutase